MIAIASTLHSSTNTRFNCFLYIAFILLGAYYAIFSNDYIESVSALGIGLAFDPFTIAQPLNERPVWQRAVVIIHLAAAAALLGYGIGWADKVQG
ncbi:MAG: hypothetical protein ACK500_08370 [Flavobacteriales bacterium]|jgi:hypothetical protein